MSPPFCTAHVLITATGSCRMWMHLTVAGINHQPFKIGAHQPEFPAVFPRSPCHAICGTADTRYPISRRTAVNPATVLLCVKSKHAIDKSPVILGYSTPPRPRCPGRCGSSRLHTGIADVVALLFILHGNTSFGSLAPIIPYRSCKHYLRKT